MIILTAPADLQGGGPYVSSLSMLHWRYDAEVVFDDRDLSGDSVSYEPSDVVTLYVLARKDGTIDAGVYRLWEHLFEKHGAQATLLFPVGESASELGNFTVSLLGDSGGDDESFAAVTPEAVTSNSGEAMPEAWGRKR